jgi:hypothetical protein
MVTNPEDCKGLVCLFKITIASDRDLTEIYIELSIMCERRVDNSSR